MKGVKQPMGEVSMPRLSDTMQEGTIAQWLKQPGDEIKKGDILAEIETDKATMDLEAYEEGTLQQILVQEGETVPIGQALALIGMGAVVQSPVPAAARSGTDGAGAAPAAAPQAIPAPAAPPSAPPPETEVRKLSRVQVLIARRLTESKQSIPHFYVSSEVDMTDVLLLRQTLNANLDEEGVKVTVNDLIVKACALALEKFPEANSTIQGEQLILYKHINVGIAVDAPTGLVVPVIRDTNTKGVRSIARESKALSARARANKLSPIDLEGGTFSVSNLGMMDASSFIAVINPPQAAILAVASTRKQYVPVEEQPVLRDLMTVTLSADHRILYGATVAHFLQEVKRLLQTPYSLLG